MTRFADRTVIVTGASRGLGRAIAQAFAAEGAWIGVNYRVHREAADGTLAAVRQAGGDGVLLPFDVRERSAINAAVDQIMADRGQIDVWINNAGIAADAPFPLMSAEDLDQVLEVNLKGVFHCCQAVCRPMLARRQGAIVNVGSVAGLHASPGQANYAAAKGGLVALTRTIATELAPRGVRVNAVIPGLLDTGLATQVDHRILEQLKQRIAMGRFGTGAEVAQVVLFLASDAASYLVGQSVVVDGGLTL